MNLINNKRGISGVVTTLITVLLAIVAIGIVWVVVSGIIGDTAGSAEDTAQCLGANLEIVNVDTTTTAGTCIIHLKRVAGVGLEDISGVMVSVNNGDERERSGNFLDTKNVEVESTECNDLEQVTARAYIDDTETGERNFCAVASN